MIKAKKESQTQCGKLLNVVREIKKYIDSINQERMADNHNVKMVSCFGESFAVQSELK